MIPRETQEGAFYRAALALHQNHFQQAQAVSDVLVSYAAGVPCVVTQRSSVCGEDRCVTTQTAAAQETSDVAIED